MKNDFCTKIEFLNFKITISLAKLDMVGSSWVSNGLNFFKLYFAGYSVSNFFVAI